MYIYIYMYILTSLGDPQIIIGNLVTRGGFCDAEAIQRATMKPIAMTHHTSVVVIQIRLSNNIFWKFAPCRA